MLPGHRTCMYYFYPKHDLCHAGAYKYMPSSPLEKERELGLGEGEEREREREGERESSSTIVTFNAMFVN